MSRAATADEIPAGSTSGKNYINAESGILSWLTTIDHKRIGLMYLASTLTAFLLGGIFALVVRLELLNPGKDILTAPQYNQAFTLHGAVMVFLFIIPSIPGALGNFLVPLAIGAKDVAFPKLNLMSLYLYWIGALFTLSSLVSTGLDTGWTFYIPVLVDGQSDERHRRHLRRVHPRVLVDPHRPELHRDAPQAARAGPDLVPHAARSLGRLRDEHHPGARDAGPRDHAPAPDPRDGLRRRHLRPGARRRPGALPALLLVLQPPGRLHHDPAGHGHHQRAHRDVHSAPPHLRLQGHRGSSLGLAFSASSCGATTCSRRARASSRRRSSRSSPSSSPSPRASRSSTGPARCTSGSISWNAPMLYAMSFLFLFTIGGLTGLFLGMLSVDVHLHDTYFVVAHFHYVMVGGTVIAFIGGLHHWWPKMTGKMYNEDRQDRVRHHLRRLQHDLLHPVLPGLAGHAAPLLHLPRPVPAAARLPPPPTENFYRTPTVTHGPYDFPTTNAR
jgi:hypothetical protein